MGVSYGWRTSEQFLALCDSAQRACDPVDILLEDDLWRHESIFRRPGWRLVFSRLTRSPRRAIIDIMDLATVLSMLRQSPTPPDSPLVRRPFYASAADASAADASAVRKAARAVHELVLAIISFLLPTDSVPEAYITGVLIMIESSFETDKTGKYQFSSELDDCLRLAINVNKTGETMRNDRTAREQLVDRLFAGVKTLRKDVQGLLDSVLRQEKPEVSRITPELTTEESVSPLEPSTPQIDELRIHPRFGYLIYKETQS
jgi:hypothetical protein